MTNNNTTNTPAANNAANVVANNTANAANAPVAVANNAADPADVTDIVDEETPLADAADDTAEDTVSDNTADDTKNIEDEATPLAATEDNCIIHWIILILTLVCGAYNLVRAFVRKKSEDAENEN